MLGLERRWVFATLLLPFIAATLGADSSAPADARTHVVVIESMEFNP
jgi:hypothetical protein